MQLLQVYKKSRGLKKLFSEVVIIDWYDDLVTGICKLDNTEEWYLCNLCYFDPDTRIRIRTLININEEWLMKVKSQVDILSEGDVSDFKNIRRLIKELFENYKGNVFLMKNEFLDDNVYDIVNVPLSYLQFFDDIEDVFKQDDKALRKWINFFQ